MKLEAAKRRIAAFEKRFGFRHLYLACHAALPLALTPDLLYRIWANFPCDIDKKRLDIPWIAVSDLILSSLCDEVGYELYEIDATIRNELLEQLKQHPRFTEERIKDLADFLLEYVRRDLDNSDSYYRDFAESQAWAALAYQNPRKAVKHLANAFERAYRENKADLMRLTSITEMISQPIPEFEKLLILARAMGHSARNRLEEAKGEIIKLQITGGLVSLGSEIVIPIPPELLPATEVGLEVVDDTLHEQTKLIQSLFTVRGQSQNARTILQTHQHLMTESLVQTIKQVVAFMSDEGNEDIANWFKDIAAQVSENVVDNSPYLELLIELLQAIVSGDRDSQVVYSIMHQNLDKLNDDRFAEVMEYWARENLPNLDRETAEAVASAIGNLSNSIQQFPLADRAINLDIAIAGYNIGLTVFERETHPESWASLKNNLGTAYSDRIRGNRAENLEIAIASYIQSLEIYTREDFPEQWARTQNNLGAAYSDRIAGDRAENLEMAIACYQAALEVRTCEAFPIYWADTQNNLGAAYSDRIKGEKADNLERAIAAYQAALEVRTREAFPIYWADTQNNLGAAYSDRIKGEKADNLERAIAAYQAALEVRTKEAFPIYWADTQNNLGNAYSKRIFSDKAENLEMAIASFHNSLQVYTKEAFPIQWAMTQNNLGATYSDRIAGDRAENIELAIAAYEKALQVRTKEVFPIDWATTQNNLGVTYSDRIAGDRAENIELAIAAYQAALEVRTCEAFPIDWAMTQNNLGAAYSDRIMSDRTENIELAIAAYQYALEVRTKDAFPIDWAMTQNNLGAAYSDRIMSDRTENIELAIAAYQYALEVRTKDAFPIDWAMTQNNLGAAYCDRIAGDRAENIELAIAAYENALQVRTLEANPTDHLQTTHNLGNLHFTQGNWQRALYAYEGAIAAVELSRSWAITDENRQKITEEAVEVYQKQVQTYINVDQSDKAIETIERSKARNLVELLSNRDLYPKSDVPQEIIAELNRLRRNVSSLERQLQIVTDRLLRNSYDKQEQQQQLLKERLLQELQQSRQQLDEVLNQIKSFDSSFSLTQKVEIIHFRDIQKLIDEETAILEWYILENEFIVFIITAQTQFPIVWRSSETDLQYLIELSNNYLKSYYSQQKQDWHNRLENYLHQLSEILHLDEILSNIPRDCQRLCLIPHRYLHTFPIHALPVRSNYNDFESQYLLDFFQKGIQYAPNLQILVNTINYQRPDFSNLFAIQNSREDLVFTDLEVETIKQYFSNATVLRGRNATKEAVMKSRQLSSAHCLHISGHGVFDLESPLDSAIILADSEINSEQSKVNLRNATPPFNIRDNLTIAEIYALNLSQCRLVTLSSCETALVDISSSSDKYVSFQAAFLFAGAKSVVGTLWSPSDISASFLMIKFYENLQQFPQKGIEAVAIALNQAQIWLRNLTEKECEEFLSQILDKLAPSNDFEFKDAVNMFDRRIPRKPHPFASPFYWAAFIVTGAIE